MKIVVLLLSAAALSGCLATTDVLREGSLNQEDLNTAQAMTVLMQSTCTKTYYKGVDESARGAIKLVEPPTMKAFYKSDSGWFKADMAAQGTFDSVFYSPSLGIFLCGQVPWDKIPEASAIRFTRADGQSAALSSGVWPGKPLQVITAAPPQTEAVFVKQHWNGSNRMCTYDDGTVLNKGLNPCPRTP